MNTSDPVMVRKVRNYTVRIDRSLCIGAATCVALASKAFALDNDAKAVMLDSILEESDEAIVNAAKGCPVGAITVIDDTTGKQLFP